ncbi:MAG: hypothetical protein OXH79_07810 [Boseongicola sp.]|nr:hypothetical protein [Boseongicola sp.]
MRWRRDQAIEGVDGQDLHHMYRAMGWLGEPLDASEPCGPAPRRTKGLVEKVLFARRRDLFTNLGLAFFDTASLHFTGHADNRSVPRLRPGALNSRAFLPPSSAWSQRLQEARQNVTGP